jgi:hypothetical protein
MMMGNYVVFVNERKHVSHVDACDFCQPFSFRHIFAMRGYDEMRTYHEDGPTGLLGERGTVSPVGECNRIPTSAAARLFVALSVLLTGFF